MKKTKKPYTFEIWTQLYSIQKLRFISKGKKLSLQHQQISDNLYEDY